MRHDFPTEWSAFVNDANAADFKATVRKDYFPYFTQGKNTTITITGLDLYAEDLTKHRGGKSNVRISPHDGRNSRRTNANAQPRVEVGRLV